MTTYGITKEAETLQSEHQVKENEYT